MQTLSTERLVIRKLTPQDAPFIFTLLNDPTWIQFIGDRQIKSAEDAVQYIQNGPAAMYKEYGVGLCLVSLKQTGKPLGLCGLIKRDYLDDFDLGFAFTKEHQGKGYGFEAAKGVLDYAQDKLHLSKIVAFTTKDNYGSAALLKKLGMVESGTLIIPGDKEELTLFTTL
ncbi:GNAT family N-acetyltransferase [Jeotgalibacillus sp. R-1-5s-1]|uniref:GNAT family N-acetyltransferase n=1 Tax=Jeotgalibacillus sp. R-1-5s-1 TaxID=2555897 RepID=UPI00106909E1|nr:GNAT family N-acetyltransferase [Jeotgalibacillus sp. R-1-5s-1]TFD99912.1 N-acetyltransferase [Jeotgalibacillus sp. R-1-5s-1]